MGCNALILLLNPLNSKGTITQNYRSNLDYSVIDTENAQSKAILYVGVDQVMWHL